MLKFASKWRGWAFLLPTAALLWARGLDDTGRPIGSELLLIAIVCAFAGIAWQLLCRRDLVNRLTYFAAAFTATAASFGVMSDERLTQFPTELGIGMGGVLTGLVYTEQWLRSRRERVSAQTQLAGDPARAVPR